MTPNITQQVIPRTRAFQRGSINPSTITITFSVAVCMIVAALSFFYLGQVQDTAGQGAEIQRLEEKMIKLREQQKALELEGAQLRSIQTIEQNIPQLNLAVSDKVTYLAPPVDKVARAND